MKRIFTILCALALVMAGSATALAADDTGKGAQDGENAFHGIFLRFFVFFSLDDELSGSGLTASSQAPYPSSRRKRQDSLTSLLLLFPRHPLRWAAVGALFPPFSGPASLQQVLVPILALGGGAGGYGVAFFCVLRLELLCSFPPWPVRIQTQDDPLQMGIFPQVGVQGALVESAEGHGVAQIGRASCRERGFGDV